MRRSETHRVRIQTLDTPSRAGRKPDPVRVAAELCGALHYFTRKLCKHGHVEDGMTMRCTRTGSCVACYRAGQVRWKRQNIEAHRAHGRAYWQRREQQGISKHFRDELAAFYANCPEGMVVDHIDPLGGKLACGLHVPWNLQYLTPEANAKKGVWHPLAA